MLRILVVGAPNSLIDRLETLALVNHICLETAKIAMECIDKCRHLKPDLLFVSNNLLWGGADGVVAYLREEWAHMPPVVLIGSRSEKVSPEFLGPPIIACLSESASFTDLLSVIRLSRGMAEGHQKVDTREKAGA